MSKCFGGARKPIVLHLSKFFLKPIQAEKKGGAMEGIVKMWLELDEIDFERDIKKILHWCFHQTKYKRLGGCTLIYQSTPNDDAAPV